MYDTSYNTALKIKIIEEYLETWKDNCHIPVSEKSCKLHIEYDFMVDKRYV